MRLSQRTPRTVGLNLVLAVVLALGVLIAAPNISQASASGATLPAGATATQGCPYGGTLDASGNCSSSTPGTPTTVLGCPNGGTLDANGNCDVPAEVTSASMSSYSSYSCPQGGSLVGSPGYYSCETMTASYAATPTPTYTWGCPSGWGGFNSNTFECSRVDLAGTRLYTSAILIQTGSTWSCPTGGSLSGSTCLGTISYYTPTSSTVFTFSCGTGSLTNYDECTVAAYSYVAVQVAGPVGCALGVASGTNCVLSYPEQWVASEVVCGQTYTGTDIVESNAINEMINAVPSTTGACVVSGATAPFSAAAASYQSAYYASLGYACPEIYYSNVSLNDAIALAQTAAATLCSGQTVAVSNPVTSSYTDPCTGLVYTATAQATEPGGGAAAAGTSAYNAAKAVATTLAENEAIAAEKASNGGIQGCGAITPATYSATPVPGDVPVTASERRSSNGSATVTYTVCSANGTTTSVTSSFTATYPGAGGVGPTGTATVYSPNNATAIAAAQLIANSDAAAASVTEASALADAAASAAANNAVALAAAFCASVGQPTSTTTTTIPSGGGGGTTTTTTSGSGGTGTSGGGVSTGGVAGGGTLDAVACPMSTTCIAVGYNTNFQSIWTVGTENGTVWSWTPEATIPSDSTGQGLLLAIACPTSTTCIATGGSAGGSTGLGVETVGTLANGGWTWTREVNLASDANGGGVLFSIDCVSNTECVAGGDDHKWRGVAASVNLVNGTWTWNREVMVASDANGGGRLLAMNCPSTTMCVAVGDDDIGQGNFAVGLKSGGAWTWSADKVVQPDNTGVGELTGVACPTTVLCIAVGYDNAQQGIESIGTNVGGRWSWTTEAPVYIGAVPMGDFAGIACSSAALCSTVGYDGLSQGQAAGLEVLAGVPGFTDQLTITVPATGGGRLLAISAIGIASYVGVGYSNIGLVIGS